LYHNPAEPEQQRLGRVIAAFGRLSQILFPNVEDFGCKGLSRHVLYIGQLKRILVGSGECSVEPSDVVIVLTTLPVGADAGAFARTLVDEHLAACVSFSGEVRSVYRWEGSVTEDTERQVIIKTTASRIGALQARLTGLHPYSVPEFIVLAAADGSADYLAWVRQSVVA
jgi:periplasmic divalent cation tolerance protein